MSPRIDIGDFAARFREALAADDFEAAARIVDGSTIPAALVLAPAIAVREHGPAAVEHTIRGATALLREQLERPMWRASAVAVVALLVGLLGCELGARVALPVGLAVAALASIAAFMMRERVRGTLATVEALAGVLLAHVSE